MLPSRKHGKNETKQPTVETEEVGNITGPWATVVNRKMLFPPSWVLQSGGEA